MADLAAALRRVPADGCQDLIALGAVPVNADGADHFSAAADREPAGQGRQH